jgi:hypothetical protein
MLLRVRHDIDSVAPWPRSGGAANVTHRRGIDMGFGEPSGEAMGDEPRRADVGQGLEAGCHGFGSGDADREVPPSRDLEAQVRFGGIPRPERTEWLKLGSRRYSERSSLEITADVVTAEFSMMRISTRSIQ